MVGTIHIFGGKLWETTKFAGKRSKIRNNCWVLQAQMKALSREKKKKKAAIRDRAFKISVIQYVGGSLVTSGEFFQGLHV